MTHPQTQAQIQVHETQQRKGRKIENIGFYAAVFVGTLYALAETVTHVGVTFGKGDHNDSFPWGVLIMVVTFSLPKILGRATAGRIWEKVGDSLPGARKG